MFHAISTLQNVRIKLTFDYFGGRVQLFSPLQHSFPWRPFSSHSESISLFAEGSEATVPWRVRSLRESKREAMQRS